MDGPELPAASDDWTADEAKAKQLLEQRLRQRPGDRPTMIALASLLASKFEVGEARGLLEKAQVGILSEPDAGALLRKLSMAKVALWRSMGLTGDGFVDCSEDRREVMLEACDLFEDALAYPENGDDPVEAAGEQFLPSFLFHNIAPVLSLCVVIPISLATSVHFPGPIPYKL